MSENDTRGDERDEHNGPTQVPDESPETESELALDKQATRIHGEDPNKEQ